MRMMSTSIIGTQFAHVLFLDAETPLDSAHHTIAKQVQRRQMWTEQT